jgi:hypothetical protein
MVLNRRGWWSWFRPETRNGKRRRRHYRPRLEALEDRCLLSVSLVQNFPGLNSTQGGGATPPDTAMAVGPSCVIESVNDAVEITDKSGNIIGPAESVATFFGQSIPQNSGDFFSDPYLVYDDLNNRFDLFPAD